MATELDLQKLVVQLEASFVKYDRAWSKAMGQTDTNVKQVQQRFDAMSRSIDNAGANAARGLEPMALQTSNIAAQFQDIAVQLSQPGTSPFLIAMQQGTQLSAVLNQSKSPIAALSAGFMQMVNPISLATIATIALGGAAVQYLGTLLGDGKNATDVIKEQNDVIRRVAENWGDAVPALKAYIDQLDRAAKQSDIEQATNTFISRQYEEAQKALGDLDAMLPAVVQNLYQMGATSQEVEPLVAAFRKLQAQISASEGKAADAEAVIDALAVAMGDRAVEGAADLVNMLAMVANILTTVSSNAAQARTDISSLRIRENAKEGFNTRTFVAEQERLNTLTSEQLDLENEIARVKSEADRADTIITDQQALEIAQGRLAAEERRSQIASAARSGSKEADREREAVVQLIAELEHELSIIGLTEQQKAVANALRRAGAAATEEERQAITNLVNETYLEQQAIESMNEQMREFQDIAKSALQTFISDITAGKNATEALGNALSNIGNRLLSAGLDGLFSGLFGGIGGGNILSGIFGGGRALGGPVKAGKVYKINENTPNSEYWMPSSDGVVMPRLPATSASGGAGAGFSMGDIIIQGNADAVTVQQLRDWSRFELPALVKRHSTNSLAEVG